VHVVRAGGSIYAQSVWFDPLFELELPRAPSLKEACAGTLRANRDSDTGAASSMRRQNSLAISSSMDAIMCGRSQQFRRRPDDLCRDADLKNLSSSFSQKAREKSGNNE